MKECKLESPPGWLWGSVEDAASSERNAIVDGPFGSNLKLSDYIDGPGVPVLTTANLRGDYSPRAVRHISHSKFLELKRSAVRPGDVLVAKIGSCGLTGVYPEGYPTAIIPANLLKMTPRSDFSTSFVRYYFDSPVFKRFLSKITTATAQPAFNVTKFRKLPFPLITGAKQSQIVSYLDLQFSRLEAGMAALKRAQENLKRCRASILKAACEGRLVPTEAACEGRLVPTEAAQAVEEPGQINGDLEAPECDLLPIGWQIVHVGGISKVKGGLTKNSSKKSDGAQFPFLRVANVYANELRLDDIHQITASPQDAERVLLKKDDLLIVEGNGSQDQVGRVALWNGTIAPCLHQNHLIRVRSNGTALPKWLLYYLLSPVGRASIEFVASSTSGLFTLSISKVSNLQVLLPPLAEQERIVAEVERRFSILDQMESVITASLSRATRLRQSILSRAFAVESGG